MNFSLQVFVWAAVFIFLDHGSKLKLQGHIVTPCLISRRTARLSSKVAARFYIATGLWRPQLHIRTNTCYSHSGCKWHHNLILLCIFLLANAIKHFSCACWPCVWVYLRWRSVCLFGSSAILKIRLLEQILSWSVHNSCWDPRKFSRSLSVPLC